MSGSRTIQRTTPTTSPGARSAMLKRRLQSSTRAAFSTTLMPDAVACSGETAYVALRRTSGTPAPAGALALGEGRPVRPFQVAPRGDEDGSTGQCHPQASEKPVVDVGTQPTCNWENSGYLTGDVRFRADRQQTG